MKQEFRIPLIALFVILSLFSCKKEEGVSPSSMYGFVLNGETYSLEKGFLEDFGENSDGSFDFDIFLASSEIGYSAAAEDFNGKGNFIYLDLNTSSANGLDDGRYDYANDRRAFTLVDATVGTHFDLSEETGDIYEVLEGTVDIKVEGDETFVEFELILPNNVKVEGSFRGVLRSI